MPTRTTSVRRKKTPLPDISFEVDTRKGQLPTQRFTDFKQAAGHAVALAVTGEVVLLDVVIGNKEGADAWGGEAAVRRYLEAPNAGAFERLEIRATSLGRLL